MSNCIRSKPLLGLVSLLFLSIPTAAAAATATATTSSLSLGDPCVQQFRHGIYEDVPNAPTCDSSSSLLLTCHVAPNDTGMIPLNGIVEVQGTCQKMACVDASRLPSTSSKEEEEDLMTICTANTDPETAALNPWIRLTVDANVLQKNNDNDDDGCGIDDEDFTIIHHHGSRPNIAHQMATGQLPKHYLSEEDYWNYWGPACPFVRQDPHHPYRCCKGSDCCGGNGGAMDDTETDSSATAASRMLEDSECPDEPTDFFSQDIYITFMGQVGRGEGEGESLADHLATQSLTIADLENAIQNEYNALGGNGQCVYYSRLVQDVTIDVQDSTKKMIPAMNKNYDLVGFRIPATIQGLCSGCADHLFLPSDNCRETIETSCSTCINDGTNTGFIQQIAGKDLYPRINAALNLDGTSVEIFRMQGVDAESDEACEDPQSVQYLEATGEVVCLG